MLLYVVGLVWFGFVCLIDLFVCLLVCFCFFLVIQSMCVFIYIEAEVLTREHLCFFGFFCSVFITNRSFKARSMSLRCISIAPSK
jgi:hypothetical protein